MDSSKKTAIILGATGLTGGILLKQLLEDQRYGTVKSFSRSSTGIGHSKLREYLGDLLNLSQFKEEFRGDEVYCCIGTTKSKTPDKKMYRKIDFGIPVGAAKLCSENRINCILVISALGANPGSSVFYNRVKGEMEEAVLEKGPPKIFILQPSIIGGKRSESRVGEWIAKKLFSVFGFLLIGPLKKYRSISPEDISRAMVWLANNNYTQTRIESDEIKRLANDRN
jgi:uncharacterized protein YbjT (DUF2867 family)